MKNLGHLILPAHCRNVTIVGAEEKVDNILGLGLHGTPSGIVLLVRMRQVVIVMEVEVGNQFLNKSNSN